MNDDGFVLADESPAAPAPRPALWLWYLFAQPKRFYRHFDLMTTSFTVFYTTWIYGIAVVMDRFSSQILQQDLRGGSETDGLWTAIGQSWTTYWMFCLVMGVIGGAMTYLVGGWWYCMRLRFSGVSKENLDESLARRVYVFSGLIWALPALLYAVLNTQSYASPLAAEQSDENALGGMALVGFLLWSMYVSYRGVRTVFPVIRWRARIWFAILPAVFLGSVMAILFAAMLFVQLVSAPLIDVPMTIDRPGFAFDHPGNWWVDNTEEDYDPDTYFTVEPIQDAFARFEFMPRVDDERETLAGFTDFYRDAFGAREAPAPLDRWGQHVVVGSRFTGSYEGTSYVVRIFLLSQGDDSVAIVEVAEESIWETMVPGFKQIRESFRFK